LTEGDLERTSPALTEAVWRENLKLSGVTAEIRTAQPLRQPATYRWVWPDCATSRCRGDELSAERFLCLSLSPVAVFIPAFGGLDRWSVRYKQGAPRRWASRLQKLIFVIRSPLALCLCFPRHPCLLFCTLLFSLLPSFLKYKGRIMRSACTRCFLCSPCRHRQYMHICTASM
jgi:hypothetical protein